MALFTEHDPAYVDAEDTNEHIRLILQSFAGFGFDHDGDGGLPIRQDVADYLVNVLCRPRNGWIRASGFAYPSLALGSDGTVMMSWQHFDRILRLDVPCRHVILACKVDRADDGNTTVSLRLGDNPLEDANELRAMFEWLREAGS